MASAMSSWDPHDFCHFLKTEKAACEEEELMQFLENRDESNDLQEEQSKRQDSVDSSNESTYASTDHDSEPTTEAITATMAALLAADFTHAVDTPPRTSTPSATGQQLPIHLAAAHGAAEELALLLSVHSMADSVDARTCSGATPLMLASARGCDECVQHLLRAGGRPTLSDDRGWQPVHAAARAGHEHVLRLLLADPAVDADAPLPDGTTALMLAAENDHAGCVAALLEAGARDDAADEDGWGAIHWAAFNGEETVMRLLLQRCGPECVGMLTEDEESPLDLAAGQGHAGIVKLLRDVHL